MVVSLKAGLWDVGGKNRHKFSSASLPTRLPWNKERLRVFVDLNKWKRV